MATLRAGSKKLRRWLYAIGAAAGIAAATVAVILMDPLPPRTVVMAAGFEGGAYLSAARRYQAILARDGVRLELRETNGSVDNLALLNDRASGVSVALAEGGLSTPAVSPSVQSLGTVFYEPIWVFYRGARSPALGSSTLLRGRVSIGRRGSGTRAIAEQMILTLGFDLAKLDTVDLTPADAADSLLSGRLDLVVMVSEWDSPVVRRLADAPGIVTVSPPRADANVALRPYLTKLNFPRGVADLAKDRPPQDVQLIATKASLLVRKDLHPAIQYLLLHAASEVNSGPGIFQHAGEFPAAQPMDFPLSEPATQYYKSGRPWLQRALPFWLSSLVSQLLFLLVPIIGVLYPLFRLLPALYGWGMRSRIFRLYDELKFLEAELEAGTSGAGDPSLSARIEDLERRADHLNVSRAYMQMLYTLRLHINMVRERIAQASRSQPTEAI